MWLFRAVLVLAVLLGALACQDEEELTVRRDLVVIDAPAPPPNPVSKRATPAHLNKVRILRYRASPAAERVRAVVVCMPGVPAGAMAYDELARRLVLLSGGAVEVWAVDRRANLLEDLTGLQAAEKAGDPDLAWRYYDDGKTVDGKRYQGLPTDTDYMSEWGLATAVADLRAVIALVAKQDRKRGVVLIGHSFGASLVQAYSAWDTGGGAAANELAGLVLMDGGLQVYKTPSESKYLNKGSEAAPGLNKLRAGSGVFMDYFGFGMEAFLTVEITAMRAYHTPRAVVSDSHVDRLATVLFLKKPPPMTAAAAVGFTLDESSSPVKGMRASCGAPKGPVETYTSPLTGEPRIRPSDSTRLYDWLDHDQVTPPELTSIKVLSRVSFEGPTNRLEWFFPSRLLLDCAVVSSLVYSDKDWPWKYGLRATQVAQIDAPVLTVMAGKGLVPKPTSHHWYRDLIAPKVGAGRPRAGAPRSESSMGAGGFSELVLPRYAHADLIHATAPSAEQDLYRKLLQWVLSNTSGEAGIRIGL